MPIQISFESQETQKDLINRIARVMAKADGYKMGETVDVTQTTLPRLRYYCHLAEEVFEFFSGDSPDYSD